MFHAIEAGGRTYEALGPILSDHDGSSRRAVLFSVRVPGGLTLWSVVTLQHVPDREPIEVGLVAYDEPTLAIRAFSDLVIEHVFCAECRQGSEPIMCPETFIRCARRTRDDLWRAG